MKYLLLLLVLVVAYMIWRNNRITERGQRAAPPKGSGAAGAQEMLSCPVCAVHFPRSEGVPGGDGQLYCSQEHRRA
jgi:uncharacterized protein